MISRKKALSLLVKLPGWKLDKKARSILKEYRLKDFRAAIRLINRVAVLAEKADHHPDIHLVGYRKLKIVLSTHSIGGLSQKDFILAGKIDALL